MIPTKTPLPPRTDMATYMFHDGQENRIRAEVEDGFTASERAEHYGVPIQHIHAAVARSRARLDGLPEPPIPKGNQDNMAAAAKRRAKMQPADFPKVRDMMRAGKTWQQVAEKYGFRGKAIKARAIYRRWLKEIA